MGSVERCLSSGREQTQLVKHAGKAFKGQWALDHVRAGKTGLCFSLCICSPLWAPQTGKCLHSDKGHDGLAAAWGCFRDLELKCLS